MALKKQFQDKRGFTAPDAYFRVVGITGNWHHESAAIHVDVYKDEQARTDGLNPMANLSFVLNTGNGWDSTLAIDVLTQADNNPVRAVYNWLKAKPEFQGAVDV